MLKIRSITLAGVLVAAACVVAPQAGRAQTPCGPVAAGEACSIGDGTHTPGGGEKVSHQGWPGINGIIWKVVADGGVHQRAGTLANDELLGHHGNDTLDGGAGDDVLWGDWDPRNNSASQKDILRGGAGNDWIYPSHGTNTVLAGQGNDHVRAYYGHGLIDCGPGRDTAQVRENGAYKLRGCEVVHHFCQHGSDAKGHCKKPGASVVSRH
jgi:Ca2+-binding RTX toxin-like protein